MQGKCLLQYKNQFKENERKFLKHIKVHNKSKQEKNTKMNIKRI